MRDLSAQLMKCGIRDGGIVHVVEGAGLKVGEYSTTFILRPSIELETIPVNSSNFVDDVRATVAKMLPEEVRARESRSDVQLWYPRS